MKRKVISLIIKIIVIELVYFVLFFIIFGFARVNSNNMSPSINGGDLALYYHLDKSCHPGDVVAIKQGGGRAFLRVVACGGDKVTMTESGKLYVNDSALDIDKVFTGKDKINGGISYPYTVPAGHFFAVGDNRDEPNDSRTSGAYPPEDIDGKLISIMRTRGL